MSRIDYGDWNGPDWGLEAGRWLARVKATMTSAKGRQSLERLSAALALYEPRRLLKDRLVNESGEACALGVLAAPHLKQWYELDEADASDIADWAEEHLSVSFTFAWLIQEANDETFGDCTPEERYTQMSGWAFQWLAQPEEAYQRYKEAHLP